MNVSAAQGGYPAVAVFLDAACPQSDFAARAHVRVEEKTESWDHSYEWASLSALIQAAIHQAEDVAGYAAILAARIEYDSKTVTGCNGFADRRARALLTAATQRAAEADEMLCELRRLVERTA